jgi:CMP-2-keto-3-deoxyoctulosonic acid synthetase
MRIHLVTLSEAPPAGVDTPEDLERVRSCLAAAQASR